MSLREHDPARRGGHRLALALAVAAIGVLTVAVSFAIGRAHGTGAETLVWVGRVLIWLPLMLIAVAPRVADAQRLAALVALALAQSLTKWMYAPRDLRFPDELQHLRTALEVAEHHTLAVSNPTLPVSPSFPGLEVLTDALSSLGDMSIFAAGTIVASVAHVALAVATFGLVRLLGRGGRLAAVAALVFAVGPHHPTFNTMFLYLAPALLLLVAGLALAIDSRRASRRLTGGLCLACLAGVIVTHHVTAIVAILVLVLGAGVALVAGDRQRARRFASLAAGGVVLAAAWVASQGGLVLDYLPDSILATFPTASGARGADVDAAAPGLAGQALAYAAFATAAILVAVGALALWRSRSTTARVMVAGAMGFYAVLAARVLAGDGEAATRGFTYTLLFAAVPIAMAVVRIWPTHAPRRRAAAGALVLSVLFAGFAAVGWPPSWQSVPGRFRIAGYESGVDRLNVAAARWARVGLGAGHRTACDHGTCSVFGAYGRQDAIPDASPLFYAPAIDAPMRRYVRERAIDFAAVDVRLSRQLPIRGEYFRDDIAARRAGRPLPRWALVKFDRAARASRVYDNGTVRIYDLRSGG